MARLSSIRELGRLQDLLTHDEDSGKPRIVVCAGTACQASGSSDVIRVAKKHIIQKGLHEKVGIRITGCHGFCEMGPFILTEPQNAFYSQVKLEHVPVILDALLAGERVEDLLYRDPSTGERYDTLDDIPFFKHQNRLVLGMNQKIDPIRIYDYLGEGGYGALAVVLSRGDRGWVIDEVKRSGLRGRGGAGFPTGRKWEMLAGHPAGRGKVLVCNADEGDPGAYMDRSVLEGNPHSIVEGMIIAAYGTGATEGVVYVRAEYPLAIKHLTIALRQAREHGLLGGDILGTGHSFDISIARGAGAFVCGEETALMRSVEGRAGEPRQRPPFPVEKGIDGKPTVINNVETWANVPIIFRMGAREFAKIGTSGSSGTKIFSLVGKIKNTGLVEVPMGTRLATIIHDIGGGPSGKGRIKAVQTGGPSGGCIPESGLDQPVDYESLQAAGSIMGSGGMIVMDESTCMVDVAKYYMGFLKDESCGKCFSCRKGTQRMHEILDGITKGKGTLDHLDLLEELALVVKDASMCGLGQTASNPVLSTLKYFHDEYVEHIVERRCRAFVCRDLTGAPCQTACPVGTEPWRYVAHIRRGEYEEAYLAIRDPNPLPSVCARVCNHPCESRCRASSGEEGPVAIRALKRHVVDRFDPGDYRPARSQWVGEEPPRVAVVGAGPAGLTAAHHLSLQGCEVTVFEAEDRPGGMLVSAIPSYRLPRDVLEREIAALLDENITLRCGAALGRDVTLDGLFADGFSAVFIAIGAHRSKSLGVEGQDADGVIPSIEFLKEFNLRGERIAHGRVGVIGGGNSAVDAARTALRQPAVKSVTIFYRRTRSEMPAFAEEIEAALEEGVILETLTSPTRVIKKGTGLGSIELVRNELGEMDSSGRRRPVPVPGTEHEVPLDTLIVAIGEEPAVDCLPEGIAGAHGLEADPRTLLTSRPGVFAGGDAVTGPGTVVEAIASGKRAAVMIGRFLRHEEMEQPDEPRLPGIYVEPVGEDGEARPGRTEVPRIPPEVRRRSFAEVETCLSEDEAIRESGRCLRCDLDFTRPEQNEAAGAAREDRSA